MNIFNFNNFIKNFYVSESVKDHLKPVSKEKIEKYFQNPTIDFLYYFLDYDTSKYDNKKIISKIPEIININSLYNDIFTQYNKNRFNRVDDPKLDVSLKDYFVEYSFYIEFVDIESIYHVDFTSNKTYRINVGIQLNHGGWFYFIDDFVDSYESIDNFEELKKETFKIIEKYTKLHKI